MISQFTTSYASYADSPFITESQDGKFAPDGYYSPQANDVWSLGIVLLNLATGRNPWKSATASDPTFQAYLHDPATFLPSVLPISRAANELLLRMLEVNWRTRITLAEVRRAVKIMDTFYSDGVLFEGSMARCPWETSMDPDSDEKKISLTTLMNMQLMIGGRNWVYTPSTKVAVVAAKNTATPARATELLQTGWPEYFPARHSLRRSKMASRKKRNQNSRSTCIWMHGDNLRR